MTDKRKLLSPSLVAVSFILFLKSLKRHFDRKINKMLLIIIILLRY